MSLNKDHSSSSLSQKLLLADFLNIYCFLVILISSKIYLFTIPCYPKLCF